MAYELFIGRRYLKVKQKQTFISLITMLSVAGVTVGVMALIIVIAVMAGFETDLKSRILKVQSHIVLMNYHGPISEHSEIFEYLKGVKGVEAVTPFVYAQVMLRSSSNVSGAILRGIDPETASGVIKAMGTKTLQKISKKNQTKGSASHVSGIILGKELARNLGVIEGDMVYLISPRGMISPVGQMPTMRQFKVVGLFESGMYEFDSGFAYVNLLDGQRVTRLKDAITGIEIRVEDIYKARNIAKKIKADLGFPYWPRDWTELNRNLFSALKLEKIVMFIILMLITLVAAFNIASSLIMMVMEKTKDIAILKAMGATDRSIKKIFIYKGMVIGLIGTTLGVVLGSSACIILKYWGYELDGDVYYLTTLPVQLKFVDVFVIAIVAMAISFLSTLYPAWQASRLNPVDAIRYG